MPMTLTAGLSRKIGEANFGSRGASINIEMELESHLVSEPAKLRERIRQLFDSVRTSLTEELNGNHPPSANSANGHAQGNGHQNGDGRALQSAGAQLPARPATSSQIKAIGAIARKQRVDVTLVLQNRFRVARLEDLSIGQASELIDTLKSSSGA
jgi:hypothetical protein